jgi:hypothetical protein
MRNEKPVPDRSIGNQTGKCLELDIVQHVFRFALLLVYFVMLMDVLATERVAPGVEHFALSIFLYKSIIVPINPL